MEAKDSKRGWPAKQYGMLSKEEIFMLGKKAGRKEVLDFIKKHKTVSAPQASHLTFLVHVVEWKAKLKKWGV